MVVTDMINTTAVAAAMRWQPAVSHVGRTHPLLVKVAWKEEEGSPRQCIVAHSGPPHPPHKTKQHKHKHAQQEVRRLTAPYLRIHAA